MQAHEAKKISANAAEGSHAKQFNEIIEQIKQQASAGKFEMWYYKSIRPDVADRLRSLGYHIGDPQFDRTDILIEIKWS